MKITPYLKIPGYVEAKHTLLTTKGGSVPVFALPDMGSLEEAYQFLLDHRSIATVWVSKSSGQAEFFESAEEFHARYFSTLEASHD